MNKKERKIKVIYGNGFYIGNQEIGTKKMFLNYRGEIKFLLFICKYLQINKKNILEKHKYFIENKEKIKNEFLKFYGLTGKIDIISGKRIFKKLKISDKILENFLTGKIKYDIGATSIKIINKKRTVLGFIEPYKLKKFLKKFEGFGIYKEKEGIFVLEKDFSHDRRELKIKIHKKQKGICNFCKKQISFKKMTIHHKIVPQSIKKIDSGWNVEGLCVECHNKKHKIFLIVNILIFLGGKYKKLKKKFNKE